MNKKGLLLTISSMACVTMMSAILLTSNNIGQSVFAQTRGVPSPYVFSITNFVDERNSEEIEGGKSLYFIGETASRNVIYFITYNPYGDNNSSISNGKLHLENDDTFENEYDNYVGDNNDNLFQSISSFTVTFEGTGKLGFETFTYPGHNVAVSDYEGTAITSGVAVELSYGEPLRGISIYSIGSTTITSLTINYSCGA